jgi:hypothetical protein
MGNDMPLAKQECVSCQLSGMTWLTSHSLLV